MSGMTKFVVAVVLALGLAGLAMAADVQGTGVVRAVDVKAATVMLAHDPIKALGWPAMTMPFKVTSPALLDKVAVGRRVQFTLVSASDPQISALKVVD